MEPDSKKNVVKKCIKHHVLPSIAILLFITSSQLLASVGNPERTFNTWNLFGTTFSWIFVPVLIAWAILWLRLPFKQIKGPPSPVGHEPLYRGNGETCYLATVALLLIVSAVNPQLCVDIYDNMGPILGTLNIVALTFCLFLFIRGKQSKKSAGDKTRSSIMYEFFMGVENHPRLFGMDVKQLTSPRLGNMMWQLFNLIFLIAGWKLHGFDAGHFVNVALQSIYHCKIFHLEHVYFTMFEMVEDHAGFYLIWGSLVWMPCFYAFQSYYFVYHRPNISSSMAILLFFLGILFLYLNYDVGVQQRMFRKSLEKGAKPITIWGKKVIGIPVKYTTPNGKQKETQLLASGWLGLGRKLIYTFELIASIIWSLPGYKYGIWCGIYCIFLAFIFVHRAAYRDEVKCQKKYGKGWDEYCQKVPYRFIPYLI